MQYQTIKHVLMGVLMALLTHEAAANLLINPTRVLFNPTDRTAEVTLINISKTTNTYRMAWVEKKAKEAGGYDDLSAADAANFPIASSMLRFSPKQVTLKPGERQTIMVAIRRPQGLANGEYRSHLLFKALPPEAPARTSADKGASTEVNILLNFAIPVVIQQGSLNYQLAMNDAWIAYDPAKKDGSVTVSMTRSGINSVIGNISAYWTPNGGQEQLIAKAGDYNFWPEVKKTNVALSWVGAPFATGDGKLRIVYEGTKDFRDKVFFEKTLNIPRSMIKMAN